MSTARGSAAVVGALLVVVALAGCDGSPRASRQPAAAATSASTPAAPEPSPTPPSPAPDGSIYFAADPRGGDALTDPVTFLQAEFHARPRDLYLARRGAPVRRVVASRGSDRCPRVSPDGRRLAYLHEATLLVAPLDAAGALGAPQVRARLPGSLSACPAWAPDGRSVGYVTVVAETRLYTARPAEVRAVSLEGRDRMLASFEAQIWHEPSFAWSPDGEEVAFSSDSGIWRAPLGGDPELLWRPAAGDPSQELPMAFDRPTSLAWSSRGEIAFTVYKSEPDQPNDPYGRGTERWAVRVMDPESGRVERVGATLGEGSAAWSPDGGHLAFRGRKGLLRVHDRATGRTRTVARGPGWHRGFGDVTWSPDGERLLTVLWERTRGYALGSVAVDGSGAELQTRWTWALDWVEVDDVDWSSR